MEFFTVPLIESRTSGGWQTLVPYGEISYLVPYPEASPSRLAPSRPMRCCSGSAPHPCRWSMITTARESAGFPNSGQLRMNCSAGSTSTRGRELRGGLSIGFEAQTVDRGPGR